MKQSQGRKIAWVCIALMVVLCVQATSPAFGKTNDDVYSSASGYSIDITEPIAPLTSQTGLA